jgi:cell division septal protein FtsQ
MRLRLFRILRILFVVTGLGCVASVAWAGYSHVHTDPRFNLKKITISDLKHVEDSDVLSRIRLKTGSDTNIFAVDMDEVRARVEQIEWVHHATVQRVLPDQIVIRVVEREAKGLARIDGHIYEFDAEGAILEPDQSPLPALPVLIEMSRSDAVSNLRKIGMYNKVIAELGSDGISQILVNAINEVSIVRKEDPLIVNLGVTDFEQRWNRYLSLKSMININYKDAVRVDLRFRNKVILSMQGEDDGGKVIWDGKKKSL